MNRDSLSELTILSRTIVIDHAAFGPNNFLNNIPKELKELKKLSFLNMNMDTAKQCIAGT